MLAFTITPKDNRLSLSIRKTTASTKMYRGLHTLLINPDYNTWDNKKKCFAAATEIAIKNNAILGDILNNARLLAEQRNPATPADFCKLYDAGLCNKVSEVITLGMFLVEVIKDVRNPKSKKESRNFNGYISLLHRLQEEGTIINKPIQDIGNGDFHAFSTWMLNVREGKNYVDTFKKLFATINKAKERDLNKNEIRFKYNNYKPKREPIEKYTLTIEQYEDFVNLDLSMIKYMGGQNIHENKELYKDFLILLYEIKSRPIDVIRMHTSNITEIHGVKCLSYHPEKFKNDERPKTIIKLSPRALAIIEKYKGKSVGGYLLPLNPTKNLTLNPGKWSTFACNAQHFLQQVNDFLKRVAKHMELDLSKSRFVSYSFRHSVITHAILAGENLMKIAKDAGTSVGMLEKHYYHHIQSIAA